MFIDGEIQVASTDEHLYSSTFVGAGLKLNKSNDKAAIIGGEMVELQENAFLKNLIL